jgi:septal ring-binding cell division protein DamX
MKRVYLATIAVLVMVAVAAVVVLNQSPRQAPVAATSSDGRTVTLPLEQGDKSAEPAAPPHLKGFEDEPAQPAPERDQAQASDGGADKPAPETTEPKPARQATASAESAADSAASAPTEPAPVEAPAPVIKGVSPEPVVGSPRRQSITVHGRDFDPKAKVTVGWTGRTRELDNWQVRVVNDEQIVFRVITGTQDDTWTVRVVNPHDRGSNVFTFHVVSPRSPQARQVTVPKEKSEPTTSDSEWLYARNPGHYTLQVLASRNGLAVANYYKDRGLEGEGHILAYRKDGQQWYVLVYGDYASHEAADQAARELAARLKDDNKPWSRSISGLQQMVLTGRLEDAAWIKVQSGSRYTLQLVAGSSRETVEAFVGKHQLTGEAAVYQTTHDGQPWYVLIYGVYDDQKQAQAAVAELPPAVRQLKPWARSFASVQTDLP